MAKNITIKGASSRSRTKSSNIIKLSDQSKNSSLKISQNSSISTFKAQNQALNSSLIRVANESSSLNSSQHQSPTVFTSIENNKINTNDPKTNNIFFATLGNTIVNGSYSNDILYATAGDTILNGGYGNGILYAGSRNNYLNGGYGADIFVFNFTHQGLNMIEDFNRIESDKIHISQTGFGASSLNQFSDNNLTGGLSFQSVQFATIANNPSNFTLPVDVLLV